MSESVLAELLLRIEVHRIRGGFGGFVCFVEHGAFSSSTEADTEDAAVTAAMTELQGWIHRPRKEQG